MALLFMDGFDHYATADILKKWTSLQNTPTIVPAAGRRGSSALRCSSLNIHVSKVFPATSSFVMGMSIKVTGFPSTGSQVILALLDAGTAQCELRVNTDGTLSVTRNGAALTGGTSGSALSSTAECYLEWKVTIADSIAANSCKVRINGVDWINVAAGQDTKNTANATANTVRLGQSSGAGAINTLDMDDFYFCDQSGTTNNDFLGDCTIEILLPNGAGNYQTFNYSGLSGAHRFWRVNVLEIGTASTAGCSIGELILRTTSGGANVATGGTASASSTGGAQSAALAFDGNNTTYWKSASDFTGNLATTSVWLQYDLGAGNDKNIIEFALVCAESTSNSIRACKLQYSDDGANWGNLIEMTGQAGWSVGETRSFTYSAPSSTHYTRVDEPILDTYDYVFSNTPGNRESYTMQDLRTLSSDTVYAVQVNAAAVKTEVGSRVISTLVRSASADLDGAVSSLGTSPVYVSQVVEKDPNGTIAWTAASVNAAEFGVKVAV